MVTAVETVTLFNRRYDAETRREVFIPTVISGVACHEVQGRSERGSSGANIYGDKFTYQIRIPADATFQGGRSYMDEAGYKALDDEAAAGHWTLSLNSYILLGGVMPESGAEAGMLTLDEIRAEYGDRIISIVEYADNTRRGSDSVKHWRIGGA